MFGKQLRALVLVILGVTALVMPLVLGADDKEDSGAKNFTVENWPAACGKQEWDVSAVSEKYIIKSAKVDENATVTLLIELKEDAANLKGFRVDFYDKDGAKMPGMLCRAGFSPSFDVKKGDVVRLSLDGWPAGKSTSGDAMWARVAKVKFVP